MGGGRIASCSVSQGRREHVLENSVCPLPAGVHLDEGAAGAGGRGVAIFTESGIGKRREAVENVSAGWARLWSR